MASNQKAVVREIFRKLTEEPYRPLDNPWTLYNFTLDEARSIILAVMVGLVEKGLDKEVVIRYCQTSPNEGETPEGVRIAFAVHGVEVMRVVFDCTPAWDRAVAEAKSKIVDVLETPGDEVLRYRHTVGERGHSTYFIAGGVQCKTVVDAWLEAAEQLGLSHDVLSEECNFEERLSAEILVSNPATGICRRFAFEEDSPRKVKIAKNLWMSKLPTDQIVVEAVLDDSIANPNSCLAAFIRTMDVAADGGLPLMSE